MSNLKQLISEQMKKAENQTTIDWELRKKKWLTVLGELNSEIRKMLISAGVPDDQIKDIQHTIHEERLGTYLATGLRVVIGTQTINFAPIASVIIGGYGRVDVSNSADGKTIKLIAHDKNTFDDTEDKTPSYERDWVWSIYPEKSSRSSYPFDEEGLTKLLEDLLR